MIVSDLKAMLAETPDDWPVMVGHRFLCNIKAVGVDIVTFPGIEVLVLESSNQGYTRMPPYNVMDIPPEPPPNLHFREHGVLGNRLWPLFVGIAAAAVVAGVATVSALLQAWAVGGP